MQHDGGRGEVYTGFWWGNLRGKRPLGRPKCRWEDQFINRRIHVFLFRFFQENEAATHKLQPSTQNQLSFQYNLYQVVKLQSSTQNQSSFPYNLYQVVKLQSSTQNQSSFPYNLYQVLTFFRDYFLLVCRPNKLWQLIGRHCRSHSRAR